MAARLAEIEAAAAAHGLQLFGGFHPEAEDSAPPATGTLVLLGPAEGGAMWHRFTASPEWQDGAPDPLDRWSRRVIGAIAARLGAIALFPSDGPPYPPFLAWARRTGRAWFSPVGMLVHESAGLMVSFRGALALPDRLALPRPQIASPCDACAGRPCLSACPVGALGPDRYDVAACCGHLATAADGACMRRGCAARRACPLSAPHIRPEEQSAHHMKAFLK